MGEDAAPVKKGILVKGPLKNYFGLWPCAGEEDSCRTATFMLEKLCMTSKDPWENSHLVQDQEKLDFRSTKGSMGVYESRYFSLCSGLAKPSEYTLVLTQTLLQTYFLY